MRTLQIFNHQLAHSHHGLRTAPVRPFPCCRSAVCDLPGWSEPALALTGRALRAVIADEAAPVVVRLGLSVALGDAADGFAERRWLWSAPTLAGEHHLSMVPGRYGYLHVPLRPAGWVIVVNATSTGNRQVSQFAITLTPMRQLLGAG